MAPDWRLLGRKAWCAVLPRRATLTAHLTDGTVVRGRNRAGHGGRGAFVHRDALEPELAVLDRLVGPGQVVVDVGANTGVYALKAGRLVGPSGTVVAIEPNPDMIGWLQGNVRANGLGNVRVRMLAAGERTGAATLWENRDAPNSFSLVRRAAGAGFSVLVVPLDELLAWEGLEHVDLVKIDVEGAEDAVLAGAAGLIERCRPLVIAEAIHRGLTSVPAGYRAVRAPGSPNLVLLPEGHPAGAVVAALGWPAA
ncbi:MAG: FkbM family methyltransferase [Acidimicrobiales bacterium]|nr:FkbM family methyltransferase [Acidimicrobiales bacterium]